MIPFKDKFAAAAIATVACVSLAICFGKDFNWDFRNYHLYSPWALLTSRYAVDYMAAGAQGYLNPVALIPLYKMIQWNWHDTIIASVLAVAHSTAIWGIIAISASLRPIAAFSRPLIALSALIGASSPLFLGTLGGTFIDPIVASFLLWSLWCLVGGSTNRLTTPFAFVSGTLAGMAAGFKLSALLCVPGLIVAGIFAAAPSILKRGMAWIVGAGIGFAVVSAWPAWSLYKAFGNPFFPMFNHIFRSPFFSQELIAAHDRFIPIDVVEFMLRPLRMAQPYSWVYGENLAPDIRLLVASMLLTILIIVFILKIVSKKYECVESASISRQSVVVASFFLVNYVVWLRMSGNGRYGLALLLLVGPIILILSRTMFSKKWATVLMSVALTAQVGLNGAFGNPRWTSVPYSGKFFTLELPEPENSESYGFLLGDINTSSFVFPFLPKESEYFAIDGQVTAGQSFARGKLHDFMIRWDGRLRLLSKVHAQKGSVDAMVKRANLRLNLIGLTALNTDCNLISYRTVAEEVMPQDAAENMGANGLLASCAVLRTGAPNPAVVADRGRTDVAFRNVASSCRRWFPVIGDSEALGRRPRGWERRYAPTDVVLFSIGDDIFLSRGDFGPFDVRLGHISDWVDGAGPSIDCRPLPPHYLREAGEEVVVLK